MMLDNLPVEIYDALYQLGLTANYTGFFHIAYAVHLAVQSPQRLRLVTKWLYPDVAAYYTPRPPLWSGISDSLWPAFGVKRRICL